MRQANAPFLVGAYVVAERLQSRSEYPFNLPYIEELDVDLANPVTLFTGENGTGKTTLLTALAVLAGLPASGGSRNEFSASTDGGSVLAQVMRPKFRSKPPDAFYFRADGLSDFARLLDQRRDDPDFWGDPYARYGGKSLKERSHGEGVTAVLSSGNRGGLFFFDEPEAALSPQRQMEFIKYVEQSVATGRCQFVIVTHSPIIMSIKGARLLDFNRPGLPEIAATETVHWAVYKKLLCSS